MNKKYLVAAAVVAAGLFAWPGGTGGWDGGSPVSSSHIEDSIMTGTVPFLVAQYNPCPRGKCK